MSLCCKRTISWLLIFLLSLTANLSGCKEQDMKTESVISEYSEIINKGDIKELSLTIYYIDPNVLTYAPLSVGNLIENNFTTKVIVNGNELEKHCDLLRQIIVDKLVPVKNTSRVNARIYYVFETTTGDKVLDVVMWGDDYSIFVNDIQCEANDVFIDIIMPFIPEKLKNTL